MVAVRTTTPESAYKAAVACIEGGIKFIEITFSVPEAESVIKELIVDSRVTVGAGTVLCLGDARKALNAGASYLVSPNWGNLWGQGIYGVRLTFLPFPCEWQKG